MDIEELFSSRGRVRLLKILLKEGQSTITRLARETGLNHKKLIEYLEILKKHGIVEERRYGRLRLYEINYKNPRVSALREIFKMIEEL
ncbi:MAG: winged helix-turn-helix domain-containing protein [Acidilobaceae archaeon]